MENYESQWKTCMKIQQDLQVNETLPSCCGSQRFLLWDFTKELRSGQFPIISWPFSYNFFIKLSFYNMVHMVPFV